MSDDMLQAALLNMSRELGSLGGQLKIITDTMSEGFDKVHKRQDVTDGKVLVNGKAIEGHLRDHEEQEHIAQVEADVLLSKGAALKLLGIVVAGVTGSSAVVTVVLNYLGSG